MQAFGEQHSTRYATVTSPPFYQVLKYDPAGRASRRHSISEARLAAFQPRAQHDDQS